VVVKVAIAALALALIATSASATRLDPYKSYRFVLYKDGRPVAGAASAGLPADGEVVKHRSGGDPSTAHKSPGRNKYEPITLERGVTQDSSFANWAGHADAAARAGLTLKAYDTAGRPRRSYSLSGCSASEYRALPNLSANANAIAIQHIKLECEGFAMDGPPRR
jgi:phage tail-like protein